MVVGDEKILCEHHLQRSADAVYDVNLWEALRINIAHDILTVFACKRSLLPVDLVLRGIFSRLVFQ